MVAARRRTRSKVGTGIADAGPGNGTPPGDLRSRRLFTRACAVAAAVAGLAFTWLVSGGTWDLFRPAGFSSNFYDVQARVLLHGHWDMPGSVLGIEGFREGHRMYMYFGPFPALLRIPVLLATHDLDGRLSGVSMLVAFIVALVFIGRLGWKVRGTLLRSNSVSWAESVTAAFALVCVGIGSTALFLGSSPSVYHESALWAVATALGAFDFLTAYLLRSAPRPLVLACLFTSFSILTRVSVGAGPLAALALLAAGHALVALRRRNLTTGDEHPQTDKPGRLEWLGLADRDGSSTWVVALTVAAVVPLVLYAATNEVKFHTLFSVPFDKQVFTSLSRPQRIALVQNGGSLFGLKFLPTDLVQYLRPDALRVTRLFPFVTFPPPATVFGDIRYAGIEHASSLTATMPALTAVALLGLVAMARPKRPRSRSTTCGPPSSTEPPTPSVLWVPAIGATLGTVGVVSYGFVTNRYLADFLPLLVVAGTTGLYFLKVRPARRWARVSIAAVLIGLAVFGMWTNMALGLLYQRQLGSNVPISVRQQFVSFQQRVDRLLFGDPPSGVTAGGQLSLPGPPGSLAIVGNCAGLYQSDGSEWHAVERSSAAGNFLLAVKFPTGTAGQYWPVLVSGTPGAGNFLAVHYVARRTVEFAYLFQGPSQSWIGGVPVTIRPGHRYVVNAVLDPNVHEMSVTLDGASVLDFSFFEHAGGQIEVGRNTLGGPVSNVFPGTVEQLRETTPICTSLRHRLASNAAPPDTQPPAPLRAAIRN